MPPGNVKTGLKESNLPPLNNDFESKVPQLFILDSRTFVAKSALSRLRAFWGALLAKIWWEGAQKHFKGPGVNFQRAQATLLLGTSGTLCSLKAEDSSRTIFLFCMPAEGLNDKSTVCCWGQ